jgi:2-iminobutanoate/2-iminopropanoate deaminase
MSRRQSIDPPGMDHKSPIPMGCRIDNIVYSSGISGHDPDTDEVPSEPGAQARAVMENVRRFMVAAGGTTEDIIRLTLFVKDRKLRDHFNKEWIAMFPDERSRPARHAVVADLGGKNLFQVEIVAVLPHA